MKDNKFPGSDGYTAGCFRIFFGKILKDLKVIIQATPRILPIYTGSKSFLKVILM